MLEDFTMAKIEQIIEGEEIFTIIKLENVAEEKAATALSLTLDRETSDPEVAHSHGLGDIHKICVDLDTGVVTSTAFDTFAEIPSTRHNLNGAYADEILFAIETAAFNITQQMSGI